MSREGERKNPLTWVFADLIKARYSQQNCLPLSVWLNFKWFLRIQHYSLDKAAGHFRSQGRWAARTMPARTIQPRRLDGAGREGGFFLSDSTTDCSWGSSGENVFIKTGHLHILASTVGSGSKLIDPVYACYTQSGMYHESFDSLDSIVVQGLESLGIIFGIYVLATYVYWCNFLTL